MSKETRPRSSAPSSHLGFCLNGFASGRNVPTWSLDQHFGLRRSISIGLCRGLNGLVREGFVSCNINHCRHEAVTSSQHIRPLSLLCYINAHILIIIIITIFLILLLVPLLISIIITTNRRPSVCPLLYDQPQRPPLLGSR